MRWPGLSELVRRLVTLGLVCLAFAMGGFWPWWGVAVTVAAAVVVYGRFPRSRPPEGAFRYDTASSQTIPDWMGFVMVGLFVAIPIWGARADPWMGAVHPSAVLVWPLALLCNAFWVIGLAYASFWLEVGPDRLRLRSFLAEYEIRYADIRSVTAYRKDLPGWMRALVPVLVLGGKFTAAGALLMARPRRGVTLELTSGRPVAIASDGFPQGMRAIEAALAAHGLAIGGASGAAR